MCKNDNFVTQYITRFLLRFSDRIRQYQNIATTSLHVHESDSDCDSVCGDRGVNS